MFRKSRKKSRKRSRADETSILVSEETQPMLAGKKIVISVYVIIFSAENIA
jgi:hypothetical protein